VKAAPVPALVQLAAPAQPDPPPDPYAQHDADSGSAVYDTLSHYFDAEAQA